MTLDAKTRGAVGDALDKAGLGGKGRYDRVGAALASAGEVLAKYGMEVGEPVLAADFKAPSGQRTIRVVKSGGPGKAPTPVKNSVLSVQWHRLGDKGPYEVVAYLS